MIIYIEENNNKNKDPRKTEAYKVFAFNLIAFIGRCQICGSSLNLQIHHIKPIRTHAELIIDPLNCLVLCSGQNKASGCHKMYGHNGDFMLINPDVEKLVRF